MTKNKPGRKPAKIPYLYDNLAGEMLPVDHPTMKSITIFGNRALSEILGISEQLIYRWKRQGILTHNPKECGINVFNLHDVVTELTSKGVAYHHHPDPKDTRKPVKTGKREG